MWYKNVADRLFELVTKHACDSQTYGRTDTQTDRITAPKTALAQLHRAVKTDVRRILSDRCPVCLSCPVCPALSVCDVGVLWPKIWMDQGEIGMQVGLGPDHKIGSNYV